MRLPIEIESAFENGATVLTANVRAARWLRREYALRQREAGRRVWATPPIEDWDSWVLRLWQAHSMARADVPLLLTSLQERSVWMRMQRDDAKLLVSPEGMAALAEEAYKLLCDYEAHAERNRPSGQTDAERFRQWVALFDRECAKQGWVSRAKLELLVTESLATGAAGDLPLPAKVVLLGFDRLAPARRRLIAALEARGVEVVLETGAIVSTAPRLVRATDRRDEITACAHWIRGLLDENPLFEKRAETRIGVIVPDMGAVRSDVERIFRRVLMPETDDVFAPSARMPFEFSLGQLLGDVPVIRAALLLLRWAAGPLSEEEISWLLLSGYLEDRDQGTGIREQGSVYLALGSFDAALRNSGSLSLEISLRNMLREMRRFPALAGVHAQLENLQKMAAINHVKDEERTPGRWADLAQVLLDAAGWRGARRRDEIDFQARARWERLLDEVALLDFDGRRVRYREFVAILETQAGEAIFAAESHGAPVQVMGALEASGQQFDAVWFLGADDQAWPARGRLHPLLPNDVQWRSGMPHATAEDDWELANVVTRRIAASQGSGNRDQGTAPRPKVGTWGTHGAVVFSHAERNKDGELRPSPLIEQVAPGAEWVRSRELLHELGVETEVHSAAKLQEMADASGMIAWPREECAGGYSVIRDQAACPFRAFAARRLNAEELNRNDWGLSAAERGLLLHRVMELLWSPEKGRMHTLGDLEAAIEEGRLGEVIEGAIADVFAQLMKEHGSETWMAAYLKSEQRRLRVRLEEWLANEAKRVPFTVEATEKVLDNVSVGGLKLRLRADRVDRVQDDQRGDGKRLLLDYKSGEVATKDWEGMRPNEPQLPLYAVFGNVEDVAGVLFARINVEKTALEGCVSDARAQLFADATSSSKLVKNPYDAEMRDEWANALVNLAEDFLHGDAQVDPKDGRKTCRFCAMPGLCRVAELREAVGEEETEAGEGDE
jgi:ATP-dependent helicase/nuclease subunit B